jgi:hypothetical protein
MRLLLRLLALPLALLLLLHADLLLLARLVNLQLN